MVHFIQIRNILFRYMIDEYKLLIKIDSDSICNSLNFVIVLSYLKSGLLLLFFAYAILCEPFDVVYCLIMINQYQLMSHIALQQTKMSHIELTATSKYITNYIEQRKTLILSKLTQTTHQLQPSKKGSTETAEATFIRKIQKVGAKQGEKVMKSRQVSQLSGQQKSNKIIKKDNLGRFIDPDKFLIRSNLYQKQKQLKLQFQKRKQYYTQASGQKQPTLIKRDEPTQPKNIEKKPEKQEQTYQQRHERRHSKTWGDQRKNYKDLMKQSMKQFTNNQQKSTTKDAKIRWKQIEQIFEQIRVYQPIHQTPLKASQNHNTRDDCSIQPLKEQVYHQLGLNEVKLSMKKIESQEQIKVLMEQMQQHFQEQLSGIMMDDNLKQEVDSFQVLQGVVNQMNFQEMIEDNKCGDAEIVQSISILADVETKEEEKANVEANSLVNIEVHEDEWIKDDPQANCSQIHIEIKKAESQIIEHSLTKNNTPELIQSRDEHQLIESKVQHIEQAQVEEMAAHSPADVSIIDRLSEILVDGDLQASVTAKSPKQKQSLQVLANQFLLLNTNTKAQEEDMDIDIPQEEPYLITIDNFDYNTVTHQCIAHILASTNPKSQQPQSDQSNQPSILVNGQHQHQETAEEENQEQAEWKEEPIVCNTMRNFGSFGNFLVIPEESEEESRQSHE